MVIETDRFKQARAALPEPVRKTLERTIHMLETDPGNPVLRAHKLKRARPLWECFCGPHYRIIYRRDTGDVHLLDIGRHSMVDLVHTKNYRLA